MASAAVVTDASTPGNVPAHVYVPDLPPGGTSGTTPPPGGLPAPTTPLLKQATDLANTDISGQVNPLQAQVDTLGKQQGQASAGITNEFNSLLPSVADSASRLEQANAGILKDVQGVWTQAGQQLNILQQNAAAQAQKLAQSTGGPISTGQFTAAGDPYAAAAVESGANDALTTASYAGTADRAAEAFAGQVFPALATEEQAKNTAYYQDKITAIQDQIAQIKATKGTLINKNLATLQTQQLKYQQDQAKLALQTKNDENNWTNAQYKLGQEDTKLALDKRVVDFSEGIKTAQLGLATRKLTDQESQFIKKYNLNVDTYNLRRAQFGETDAVAQQRLSINEQKNAMAMIDAAMGGGKPVTLTVPTVLKSGDPLLQRIMLDPTKVPPTDFGYNEKTGQWIQYRKETLTPAQWATQSGVPNASPITDPQRLYDLLTSPGANGQPTTPPTMARNLIRLRLHKPGWNPK